MAKSDGFNFFADVESVPAPVGVKVEDLTKPKFREQEVEDIEFENVGPGSGTTMEDTMGSMIRNRVDEKMDEAIDESIDEDFDGGEPDFDDEFEDSPGSGSLDIEFEGEELLELIEEGRESLHTWAFDKFLDAKEIQRLYDMLALMPTKTAAQVEITAKLQEYLAQHREFRGSYLEKVPYTEKRKDQAGRILNRYLPKLIGSDRMPPWMLIVLFLLLTEGVAFFRLFRMSNQMPQLGLNLDKLEKDIRAGMSTVTVQKPPQEVKP